MLKIKLLLLCTVVSCICAAQMSGEKQKNVMNEDNLFFSGEITEYFEGDFLPGTVVKATSDGKVVSQGTTDADGRFELVLHFDKQYQITISRSGFVSKKMTVDTRGVPDHKHYKCPDMEIPITLFKPMKCLDMEMLSKPVAKFIYFPKKNVIDPDMDYSGPLLASIDEMLNDCIDQLEEETEEEEKRKEEEAARAAELAEQKKLEEKRAKEEAKRKAEEEARLAEQKRLEEEQAKKEAAALAEKKRLEEERAKKEARRKEEEAAKVAAEKAKEEEEAARAAELAEQQRLAEEEARKRGDEAKAAELAEQRRLAEEEAQRKEEERAKKAALAEQKKLEEERKREEELAEQQRLADEKAKEEARAKEQVNDKVEKRDLITQKSLPKKKPKTTPKKQPVRSARPSYSREKKDYSNTMRDSRLVLETVIGYKQVWDPVKKKWKKEPILQDVEYSPH